MVAYHNMFYTPVYVAVAGGFFYAEGLDVMFSVMPDGESSIDMLRSERVDVIQTGISRTFMDLDMDKQDAPLHIAEINQGDGFYLISKKPTGGWTWKDLEGSSIIPIGFTPVPTTSLKSAMRLHGVDASKVQLIEGMSAGDALAAFGAGDADYIQMPHPFAQQLINDGVGHMATAVGVELGYICYSSLAAMPAFIGANTELLQKFVNGFYKAQQWLANNSPSQVAERVSSFFPDVPSEVLAEGIRLYQEQGTWATDPMIGQDGFDSMLTILIDGGLVQSRHAYDKVVQPKFAKAAMAGN
jgi:NitT/TauT family transport system substrate-binding protein